MMDRNTQNAAAFHCKWICDLSSGGQSTSAGGGEPRGRGSAGGGGLSRRYAPGEDPERSSWHCPVAAPHSQRSTEPAFACRILTRNVHDAVLDSFQSFSLFIFTLQHQLHASKSSKEVLNVFVKEIWDANSQWNITLLLNCSATRKY